MEENKEPKGVMSEAFENVIEEFQNRADQLAKDLGFNSLEELHESEDYHLDMEQEARKDDDGEVYDEVTFTLYQKIKHQRFACKLNIVVEDIVEVQKDDGTEKEEE